MTKTLLIAVAAFWMGDDVPLSIEMGPIVCAAVVQALTDGSNPAVQDEEGQIWTDLDPDLVQCIEVMDAD